MSFIIFLLFSLLQKVKMLVPDQVNPWYAALLAAGGAIGYLKAENLMLFQVPVPSLVAGVGSGAIVAAFTFYDLPYKTLAVAGKPLTSFASLSTVDHKCVSGVLAYVMGMRFANSHKIMPAGIIAAASIGALLVQLAHMHRTNSLQ
ncbi:transmembrane protein 14C [Ostertagia ostertagi]